MWCEKRKGEEVGYKDRSVNSCFFFNKSGAGMVGGVESVHRNWKVMPLGDKRKKKMKNLPCPEQELAHRALAVVRVRARAINLEIMLFDRFFCK